MLPPINRQHKSMYAHSTPSRFSGVPHGYSSRTKEIIGLQSSTGNEDRVATSLIQNLPLGRLNRRDTTFGEQVTFIQAALLELGLMNHSAVRFARGNYGPRTTAAVSSIQSSAGLQPTGVYDEAVRAQLAKMLHAHRSQRGDAHPSSVSQPLTAQPGDAITTLHYTSRTNPEGRPVPHHTTIKDARPLQDSGALTYDTHGFSGAPSHRPSDAHLTHRRLLSGKSTHGAHLTRLLPQHRTPGVCVLCRDKRAPQGEARGGSGLYHRLSGTPIRQPSDTYPTMFPHLSWVVRPKSGGSQWCPWSPISGVLTSPRVAKTQLFDTFLTASPLR